MACSTRAFFRSSVGWCEGLSLFLSLVEMGHGEAGLNGRDVGWGKCGRDSMLSRWHGFS